MSRTPSARRCPGPGARRSRWVRATWAGRGCSRRSAKRVSQARCASSGRRGRRGWRTSARRASTSRVWLGEWEAAMNAQGDGKVGRREFLGTAAAAGVVILEPRLVWGTQANSAVRLGLLGCGGRGRHVTTSFLGNTDAVVTAIGDLFPDPLEIAHAEFDAASSKRGKPAIDAARMFRGPGAAEQLFACKEVDAVYVATPPYFHPSHLELALAANKHVYLEKPVAVDVPGAKKVMALGERARGRQR